MRGLSRERLAVEYRRLIRWSEIDLSPADMEIARSMSGLFWLIGAIVTALLLPWAPPTEELGDAGWPLAILGVLIALWVGQRHFDPTVSLRRIFLAGFAGLFLIAALEFLAGGREAPYHYLYMLPVLFAAAAQSPRRVLAFSALVAVVIWLPLLYEGTDRGIVLDIATQIVTLFAVGCAVWALFVILRMQRRTIREQRAQAELLARQDALTGLGNRRAFGEALNREVARARRGSRVLSVLVADLDNFKQINDRSGHAAGDEYLRRAADAITLTAREADACFRWGGDEFAILLPETDRDGAEGVAERLRTAIAGLGPPGSSPPLEITCGVAELDPDQDAESLIARADRDLISRKQDHHAVYREESER